MSESQEEKKTTPIAWENAGVKVPKARLNAMQIEVLRPYEDVLRVAHRARYIPYLNNAARVAMCDVWRAASGKKVDPFTGCASCLSRMACDLADIYVISRVEAEAAAARGGKEDKPLPEAPKTVKAVKAVKKK